MDDSDHFRGTAVMSQEKVNDVKKVHSLTTEETEFKREIGVFGGVSVIMGIMVGSGIFYLGSYVLERTGMNEGLSLLCWLVAGIVSLLAGLCFAELGAAMPRAGGRVLYLNEAYHPVFGFMTGFTDWLIGGPGSVAAVSIATMTILKPYLGLSEIGVKASAVVLIVGCTLYNLFGVKIGSIVQNIFLVGKLIPILIVMVPALAVGKAMPSMSLESASVYAQANNTNVIGMMAIAIVAAMWAYEGWSNINSIAEEIKKPHRNLPLALIIGIGGATLLYILFNFAIMKVLPHDRIAAMIKSGDVYLGTAVAVQIFGKVGGLIVSIGMVIAIFGSMNGVVIAQPRMYYAMAEEGHFFKSFARLHPKYRVPTVPLIVQCVFSVALVMLRNLDQLTNLVVLSVMLFNVLVVLAVPILRKKYPDIERPYKVWFYPFSVIIVALVFVGLFVQGAIDDPVTGLTGFVVPVVGAFVYWLFDVKIKREKRDA